MEAGQDGVGHPCALPGCWALTLVVFPRAGLEFCRDPWWLFTPGVPVAQFSFKSQLHNEEQKYFPTLAKDDIWTSHVSYHSHGDYTATGNYP